MNYTALSAALVAYTENTSTEFAAQIPTFVQQAETRIYNSIQFPALRKSVTGTTTASNKYFQCPTDFLSVYEMAVVNPTTSEYEYLLDKDVSFIRQAYPVPTSTGIPKYYALFGPRSDDVTELTFILGPTPADAYTVELHYFYYPESITTAASGRTWLGDNFDPVLFYGALVEAATYMKQEADLVALYNQKYQEALALAKRLGDGLEKSDAYRNGQARVPVT